MKTRIIISQAILSMIPLVYLLLIWNSLPDSVPLHYNMALAADRYGSKITMAGVLLFMSLISIGTSLLVLNVNRIDPKQRDRPLNSASVRVSWAVTIFMMLISVWIVYYTSGYPHKGSNGMSVKHLVALVSLLYVALGNYMNNIKPNYFVGIRTPWTLSDDDNWRRTHHLGSRVWFYGGIVMFALAIVLPTACANYVMIGGTFILAIVPIGYSYKFFRNKTKGTL
jgi:uncharacterized membrane protein